ncbi:MAG: 50S ribosomal protein L21 [Chloroflexi bacterium]|uniref:Large ribosomal subunit protein bL21 n=1 Tax=Candidatus Chlorohelix allophototropha TaxID=3003348 RepID=A0A8T7LW74_9CHLR|nr:50S ribosomal protein L21 [Chloroflexota bacterium]WJW67071.1 50S ribosomal protein L21 [Chloroflexota bacterium L227-S17]
MFAVVESGSKQYKVEAGQTIQVDRLLGDENAEVQLEKVLLISADGGVTVGTPIITGAAVRATIVSHDKGEKLYIFKYKSKKRYRRKTGFRSSLTTLKIEEIVPGN